MKSNMKRFLGILLAALMVVTMLPAVAFADGEATATPNAFTVGGETYLLTGASETVNGETYYQVLNANSLYSAEGEYGGYNLPLNEELSTDSVKYVDLNFRSQYGTLKKNGVSTGVYSMNNDAIEAILFPSEIFGDNLLEREWVHSNAWPWNDATVKLATIGTVGTLSSGDLKALVLSDGSVMNFGQNDTKPTRRALAYDFNKWSSHAYMTYVAVDGSTGQAHYFKGQTDFTYRDSAQGCFFGLAYVNKEFFKSKHIDIATMGENVKKFYQDNFTTLDLGPAGYTEEELNQLGIQGVPCPEGNTFEVGGKNYVLMDSTKEINGKTYCGVLSTESLNPDWNKAVMHFNYLTDKVYGATGDILIDLQHRNPDSDVRTSIQTYVTKFAPFGSYIAPATTEWNMTSGTTRVYYTGSVGLPTSAELIAVDAEYPLTYATYNKGIIYNNIGDWTGNFYNISPLIHDGETLKGNGAGADINKNNDGKSSTNAAGTWYFMTYVSEDFFLDGNVEISTMAKGVRDFLAANYYVRDFNENGYNVYELAEIGIKAQPDDATTVVDWSPDYIKFDGMPGLLYNGIVDGDYISFTYPVDIAGTQSAHGIHAAKQTTDVDGNAVTGHGIYNIANPFNQNSGISVSDKTMGLLPDSLKAYIPTRTFQANSGYWCGLSTHGVLAPSLVKASVPSGDIMIRHGSYLASQIADNNTAYSTKQGASATKDKIAIVNNLATYSQLGYDPVTNAVVSTGVDTPYLSGSIFPEFYVHKDILKNHRVDIKLLGANVKALFAGLVKSDFTVDYTAAEFEALGVKAYIDEVKDFGSRFTAGELEYILTGFTDEVDGKKYYAVLCTKGLAEGTYIDMDLHKDTELSTTDKIYADMYVTGGQWSRLTYTYGTGTGSEVKDKWWKFTSNNVDLQDMQEKMFPAAVFGDNLLEREWEMGSMVDWGDSVDAELVVKGTVCLLSKEEMKKVMAENSLKAPAKVLTRSISYWSPNYYIAGLMADGSESGSANMNYFMQNSTNANKWENQTNSHGGTFYFTTYVSEDYFKTADIDMTTAGEGFKAKIRADFERADLTGWSDANLDILYSGYFGSGLGLEVAKTANGAEVVVHNNGTEATDEGLCLIVASYDANGLVDVKTFVLEESVSAGSKTSAIKFGVDLAGATEVKAMLWDNILSAKPLTGVVSAN